MIAIKTPGRRKMGVKTTGAPSLITMDVNTSARPEKFQQRSPSTAAMS